MPGLSRPQAPDPAALFAPLAEFDRIALAVSGGPDSLALMLLADAFCRAGGAAQRRFVVYSVDHGLRPEAAAEAAFVVREAERLGFFARVLRWDGAKPATGVQEAARTARYRLFAAAMERDGAQVLVTAHHLGDQAETVLMRLAHGSGVEGLRGMDYMTEIAGLRIVRPLLHTEPEALRDIVAQAGLAPVHDPSNTDLDYERVRWRQLMPQLAALGLDTGRLARFADRMRETESALVSMTAEAMTLVAFNEDHTEAAIGRNLLQGVPRAIAVRVLARTLDRIGGGQKPHALGAVEALAQRLLREPVRATLHGCLVSGGKTTIRIRREPGREAARKRRAERAEA